MAEFAEIFSPETPILLFVMDLSIGEGHFDELPEGMLLQTARPFEVPYPDRCPPLTLPGDTHPSAVGHAIYANRIWETLRQRGLLPLRRDVALVRNVGLEGVDDSCCRHAALARGLIAPLPDWVGRSFSFDDGRLRITLFRRPRDRIVLERRPPDYAPEILEMPGDLSEQEKSRVLLWEDRSWEIFQETATGDCMP